ncbi:MAG: DMT family transporter [Alphaproteobacteria bacterium]|nr:DMT family transporter [Alphaproteobacteria bacterium]
MPTDRRLFWIGIAAGFGAACMWSSWNVVSRFGMQQTLTGPDIAALRFLVAGTIMLPFALRRFLRRDGRGSDWGVNWRKALFLAAIGGGPFLVVAFVGLKTTPAAQAAILMNGCLPLLSTLAGWALLGDRPGPMRWAGVALIVAGVGAIGWRGIAAGAAGGDLGFDRGHAFILLATGMLCAYMLASRAWRVPALSAITFVPILNLLLFVPVWALFMESRVAAAPWSEIAFQALFQGFGPGLVGLWMFTRSSTALGAAGASACYAAVPAITTLLGIPILGEMPGTTEWLGIAVVSAGILLATGVIKRAAPP